jgi:hypothetical protein
LIVQREHGTRFERTGRNCNHAKACQRLRQPPPQTSRLGAARAESWFGERKKVGPPLTLLPPLIAQPLPRCRYVDFDELVRLDIGDEPLDKLSSFLGQKNEFPTGLLRVGDCLHQIEPRSAPSMLLTERIQIP